MHDYEIMKENSIRFSVREGNMIVEKLDRE